MSNERRTLPPLNALRVFEATARLGSVVEAGDELHVTHGAVSRQIATLEDWFGFSLFERNGRRLRLTENGRLFSQAVGSALDEISVATTRLKATTKRGKPLVINALPTFAMRWLLPRLAGFQRRRPELELQLVTSEQPLGLLMPGSFDVAIRRAGVWPSGIRAEPFLAESEIPVASPALLARLPVLCIEDLKNHVLLHADTRPDAWSRWLYAAGAPDLIKSAGRQRFDHYYLALQAATDGLGITLGPLPIIKADLAAGRLVAPLSGPALASPDYCWAMHWDSRNNDDAKAFCEWLSEEGLKDED